MKSQYRPHVLSVLATAVFLLLAAGSDEGGSSSSSSGSDSTPPVPDSPAVLNSAKALDEKYGIEATSRCASDADDYLRSIAKYDFKWDETGFLEQKFDKYKQKTPSPGVITLVTNKSKLQNGFGAFQHIVLQCDYDTQAKKVLGYRFFPNE
jgi:hypothetical protein